MVLAGVQMELLTMGLGRLVAVRALLNVKGTAGHTLETQGHVHIECPIRQVLLFIRLCTQVHL